MLTCFYYGECRRTTTLKITQGHVVGHESSTITYSGDQNASHFARTLWLTFVFFFVVLRRVSLTGWHSEQLPSQKSNIGFLTKEIVGKENEIVSCVSPIIIIEVIWEHSSQTFPLQNFCSLVVFWCGALGAPGRWPQKLMQLRRRYSALWTAGFSQVQYSWISPRGMRRNEYLRRLEKYFILHLSKYHGKHVTQWFTVCSHHARGEWVVRAHILVFHWKC